jgi:Holliday junction resolvase RusA-like endonuclease
MILIEMIYDGLPPVPAMRARSSQKTNRHYTPKKYADYKRALANAVRSRYCQLVNSVPQTGTKERSKYLKDNRLGLLLLVYRAENRGDCDNFTKSVQDALQDSGVVGDDSQIDWNFCAKLTDKTRPRVEFILCKSPDNFLDWVLLAYNTLRVMVGGQRRTEAPHLEIRR